MKTTAVKNIIDINDFNVELYCRTGSRSGTSLKAAVGKNSLDKQYWYKCCTRCDWIKCEEVVIPPIWDILKRLLQYKIW
jgi:hypothetical protein